MNKNIEKVGRKKKNRYSFYLNDEDKEIFFKKLKKEGITIQRYLYDKIFKEKKDKEMYKLLYSQIKILRESINKLRIIYQEKPIRDNKLLISLDEIKEKLNNFNIKERS